ncbi:hypothetical protein L596_028980 [Steinernema carpocapsae]|uniref:Protein kinase domain-containing protein n=1 Tax=Steinernema carpocapsae TaxID=34508 RepID=A0A4U5LT95_STECR|nr:hypothetical protein L596_028980 [Steinernema carpocapsae]
MLSELPSSPSTSDEVQLNFLDARDVEKDKMIGKGSFGEVYKARLADNPTTFAVKVIVEKTGKTAHRLHEDMLHEARLLARLDGHDHVVKLVGVVDCPMMLVMEFCPQGSLVHTLQHMGETMGTQMRIELVMQAIQGLEWMHKKGVIHRDLAARNCLISDGVLKLCDFGISCTTAEPHVNIRLPMNVRWTAPEVWITAQVSFASDIYAFAVLLWEIFTIPHTRPFCNFDASQVRRMVIEGARPAVPPAMPPSVAALMQSCWGADPDFRPSAFHVHCELQRVLQEHDYDPYSCTCMYEKIREAARKKMQIPEVPKPPTMKKRG